MTETQINSIVEELQKISFTLTTTYGGSRFTTSNPNEWNHHFYISNLEDLSYEKTIKVEVLEDCFKIISRFFNNGKTIKDLETECKGLEDLKKTESIFLYYFRD